MIGHATRKILILLAWAAVFPPWAAGAQITPPSEYEVKAAFLFNFAKFVEWPPRSFSADDTPIRIGIMGEDPFGADLERTIDNKKVNGRGLVVHRSRNVQELKNCHILFIGVSEKRRLADVLAALESLPVLTVSDLEQFSQPYGGIIQFIMEGNKVRFKINAKAAERAQLRMSSKLLNLSK